MCGREVFSVYTVFWREREKTTVSAVFTYLATVFEREILVGENATVILRFGETTYIREVLTQLQVGDLG